ncbi:hypothetical protein HPB49_015296 [Dermacentor silvarum]|uniref:Uncharacterized protein n=1 Tax=Dermacentor silvarum TaxID=543639 RepID=A0ACB8CFZ6_DERSI|nr:hypothetical protein HPB49_015296 [Dermacentor silvarum]
MAGLPRFLQEVERLCHAIYADDLSLWTCTGSDGEIQDRLQRAVDIVQADLVNGNLECAAHKSELILMRSSNISETPSED